MRLRLPRVQSRLGAYGLAIAVTLAAFAVRVPLQPIFGAANAYTLCFAAVMALAYALGRGPAVAAAILGGALSFFTFVTPEFGITPSAVASLLVFTAVASVAILLITNLTGVVARLTASQKRFEDFADTHAALFQNLQARIGTHMRLVAGLLALQSKGEPEPQMADALRRAGERSMQIGRVNRELSGSSTECVNFPAFARSLANATCLLEGRSTDLAQISDSELWLEPEEATSLGVALCECLSWMLRHRPGVVVQVRFRDGAIDVAYADLLQSSTLASAVEGYMFRAMVEQVGATVSFEATTEEGPRLRLGLRGALSPEGPSRTDALH